MRHVEGFSLVGRFPLNVRCNVIANAAIISGDQSIRINKELDSPVFLYKHQDGFFIQVASQTNGCMILLHEDDVEFFDDKNKEVDLYEIDVSPLGA